MKKTLCIITFLFLALPIYSMDLKTFDIRETYFNVNYMQVPMAGRVGHELKSFAIKGVWADPNKLANRVMYEDLYCNVSTKFCTSSIVTVDFFGVESENLNPYLDVFSLQYDMIDKKGSVYKLCCPQTEYTIEIDITKKKATKYKIFRNGDINMYSLIIDEDSASKYLKTFIPQ